MQLEPRISFLTLGVRDLARARQFYEEAFGWTPAKSDGGIVFYSLKGFFFALFPSDELAADAKVPAEGSGFRGVTLAYNVRTKEETDAVYAELCARGATPVLAPETVFWGGYRGYIADPDGHLWEICFNPFVTLDADGSIQEHA